jgi:hypothetical protein
MSILKYLNKARYTWKNNNSTYENLFYKSKVKINKNNGSEVLFFIVGFLEKYGLASTPKNVNSIEKALHNITTLTKELLMFEIAEEFEFL